MPIDPNIPLQARGVQLATPESQLNMMASAAKLNEYTRSVDEQNALRDLIKSGVDIKSPEARQKMYEISPEMGMKFEKSQADLTKSAMEGKKLGLEVDQKKYDLVKTKMADLAFNPSDNNIKAHLEDGVLRGEVTPQQAEMTWQGVSKLNGQQRSEYFTNLGMKAQERAQLAETTRSHKVNEGIAGGHLALAKEARGDVGQTLTDSAGNVTLLDKQGNVMKQLGQVGKPSATYEKTAALQKQQGKDINLAISEIENAIKPGGTLEKATSSGAGKLRDAAGNFIGYATEGSIAAASLKPVGDLALKMVPRFEGPQSDKDTASYKEASGQLANESLPVATRKAAAQTVLRLMKARKGQFVNEAMASEGIGASGVDTSNPLLK